MPNPLRPPPSSLLDGAALFLDFDGTLVELAESPDSIRVPGELRPLLARLSERLCGRLALVTGRSIADLERHLGPCAMAVAGSHGLELRLAGGAEVSVSAPEGLARARDEIRRFAAGDEGLLVEEKPASIALHFRLSPGREAGAAALFEELAGRTGFQVQAGKMVLELRPRGADKGDALRRMMAEPTFAGARPLFVGDDLTDEDAFVAAAELGGGGILVGAPRDTAARWRLDGVPAALRWLEEASRG